VPPEELRQQHFADDGPLFAESRKTGGAAGRRWPFLGVKSITLIARFCRLEQA